MKAMRCVGRRNMTQPLQPIFERAAKQFEIPNIRNVGELVEFEKATADRLWLSKGRENLLRNVPHLWASGVEALRVNKVADPGDPESSIPTASRRSDEMITIGVRARSADGLRPRARSLKSGPVTSVTGE